MSHSPLVTPAETFPIGIAVIARDMGMAVRVMIIGIRVMMMFEVMAGRFDAVMIAFPLYIAEILRGSIPIISILRSADGRRTQRGGVRLHHGRAHQCQRKGER